MSPILNHDFLLAYSSLWLVSPYNILIYLIAFITPQISWVYTLKICVDTLRFGLSTLKSCVDTLQICVATKKGRVATHKFWVYTNNSSVITPYSSVLTSLFGVDTQNYGVALHFNNLNSKKSLPITTITAVARTFVLEQYNFREGLNKLIQLITEKGVR